MKPRFFSLRLSAAVLVIVLIFSAVCISVSAESALPFDDSGINTASLLLVDKNSGEVLYSKDSDVPRPIASVTKIMTCILALENITDPDTHMIEVKSQPIDDISGMGASTAGLENHIGESFSALDIIYALMLPSGCEAAQILAYDIADTPENFVAMMNEKAAQLGCQNTSFVDAHGVNDLNISTAQDLAVITQHALSNDLFRQIVSTQYYEIASLSTPLFNTNYLICEENNVGYYYKYATGVKTGFTTKAGKCLVSTATKGSDEFICIALGGKYSADDNYINHSMLDSVALYEWALENHTQNINIDITRSFASVQTGETLTLSTTTDSTQKIEWTSSNENVATVDSNGVVTGKSLGQAKIKATTPTGNFDTVTVSVGFENGIDVTSRYGDYSSGSKLPIDWAAVKNSGFDYAVIRAGWGSEDYPLQNDAEFVNNVQGAHTNGVPFYLSFIAYAQSADEAVAEADYFLREMNEYFPQSCADDLIDVVYNMTYSPYSSNSAQLNTSVALAFAQKLRENGYNTLIFANKSVYNNLDTAALKENGVGLYYSYYPYIVDFSQPITLPSGEQVDMWQYRSDGYFPPASENSYAKLCISYTAQKQENKYDVDGDGRASVLDAQLIQLVLAQIKVIDDFDTYADVDGDGRVSILDASLIQRHLAHLV